MLENLKSTGLAGLAILACTITFSGCSTVFSTRPLGVPVWSEMQGIWEVRGVPVGIELLPDGSLIIGWFWWDENEQLSLEKHELVISVDEGATYWNIGARDAAEGSEEFVFLRVLLLAPSTPGAGPDLVLFQPEYALFRGAVEKGILRGKLSEWGTHVDGSQLPDFVDPRRLVEQFGVNDQESGILVRRIVKTDGPDIESTVLYHGQQAHMECLPQALPQRKAADVRDKLKTLKSELEKQLERPIEMPDAATEQWAKFLNIDPEQWARLMAPFPPGESRYSLFDKNGVVTRARLSAADFSSYLTCLDARGFGLVNISALQDNAAYGAFWVAKEGFGLFAFRVRVE
jgi:hypothetical protein